MGDGGGVARKSLDTDGLVKRHPREGEDEREKETEKRRSKRENEFRRKTKNLLRHRCYSQPHPAPPSLFLHSRLSCPSICPCGSSLFSSITSFCLPPSCSSNSSHPLPLLYTRSIIWETRLRAMSRVRAIIIIASFRCTVNYSPPYRKQTFKL